MQDLTEFLLERIAVDEAWLTPPTARRMIGGKMVDVPSGRLPSYVERDRKRWAAECEAKRRIVELAAGINEYDEIAQTIVYAPGHVPYGEQVLRALAAPYADHPDYREEWRP